MRAFFDTNVYINAFFKRSLPREEFARFFSVYEIFVCPVVRHELLLGTVRQETKRELDLFLDSCPLLEVPGQVVWSEMTDVMRKLHWKENRQQNDVLIALTARESEAALITYDRHFERLKPHIDFDLVLLEEANRQS